MRLLGFLVAAAGVALAIAATHIDDIDTYFVAMAGAVALALVGGLLVLIAWAQGRLGRTHG